VKGQFQELLKAGTAVRVLFYWIKQHPNIWAKYKEQMRELMYKYCVPVFQNILQYKAYGFGGSAPIVTSQSLDQ
jgi:hypothetical protein